MEEREGEKQWDRSERVKERKRGTQIAMSRPPGVLAFPSFNPDRRTYALFSLSLSLSLSLSPSFSLSLSLRLAIVAIINQKNTKKQQQQPELDKSMAAKPPAPPPSTSNYPGAITLTAANGASASFVPGGAALQRLLVPDAEGKLDDIALGWDDPTRYEVQNFRGFSEVEKEAIDGRGGGGARPRRARRRSLESLFFPFSLSLVTFF